MDTGDLIPWGRKQRPLRRVQAEAGSPHDDAPEKAKQPIVRLLQRRDRNGCRDLPGLPDLDRILINPAAVFGSPEEVVRHPLLTLDCKREILCRWAWDEYLLDLALADGMPEGEPSRLAEVKAALRLLGQEWSPDPAAPAARALCHEHPSLLNAA